MKKLFLTIGWIAWTTLCFGQLFSSVKCTPKNDILGYPVIRLGSNDLLHVSFDELSSDAARSLEYRFVLCNANWTTASLRPIQYISGMNRTPIDDIRFSINTRADYTHYQFSFPDERTRFLVSGNYKCEIYDVNDPETTLLTIHFFVTEDAVAINGKVIPPKRVEFRRSRQQLEFDITSRLDIIQPYQNLTVLVQQNGRTDNVRRVQPKHAIGRTFKFADSEDLVFDGGNEFRNFDTKFLNFNGHGVENISILDQQYFVLLNSAESRATKVYADNGDINGRFVIRADRRPNPEIEAEYTGVFFTLFTNYQGDNVSVHVFGELTNWAFGEISEMDYNFERNCYTKLLFLKQGFYDYQFVLQDNTSLTADITRFEGNHYETKNNYTIYVYYRGNSDHHDRLIGTTLVRAHE
ncbi:MAG: DUF5103 domain-containing protein [Bacteroidales bacterium]|nr:DUF5103 domain-containing protein [Bacteroidales bacterium]